MNRFARITRFRNLPKEWASGARREGLLGIGSASETERSHATRPLSQRHGMPPLRMTAINPARSNRHLLGPKLKIPKIRLHSHASCAPSIPALPALFISLNQGNRSGNSESYEHKADSCPGPGKSSSI